MTRIRPSQTALPAARTGTSSESDFLPGTNSHVLLGGRSKRSHSGRSCPYASAAPALARSFLRSRSSTLLQVCLRLASLQWIVRLAQSFLNYFFLAFVYGLIVVFRTGDRNFVKVMSQRGWKYFLLAFIDVQANYLIVYAYQFTNLTSIQVPVGTRVN